ncbi:MAG: DUF1294 domain-containing protein [Planctomycetota bacterium]
MLLWTWVAVIAWNVLTMCVYGWDKWRAGKQGARRVPERNLLLLLFACGPVGAWVGMQWFRHKTKKQPFGRWAMLWTVVNPLWLIVYWTITELA